MKRNRHTHKHHTHTLAPTHPHHTTHVVRITLCTHILNTQHTQIPDYTPHLTCGSCCGTGVARQTLWASCRRACALHRPRRRPPDTSSARAFTLRTLRQRYNCKYSQKKLTHIHTHSPRWRMSVLCLLCADSLLRSVEPRSSTPLHSCCCHRWRSADRRNSWNPSTWRRRSAAPTRRGRCAWCVRVCLGVYACV